MDHSQDLNRRRLDQAIQQGNEVLRQKKGEMQKLELNMEEWEKNLRTNKPKLDELKREVERLEKKQHEEIAKQAHMVQERTAELHDIKNMKPDSRSNQSPRSFL